MEKNKKIRGTFSSWEQPNGDPVCDIDEVAKIIASNVGEIPEHIGYGRACEIHLLAKAYLYWHKKARELLDE